MKSRIFNVLLFFLLFIGSKSTAYASERLRVVTEESYPSQYIVNNKIAGPSTEMVRLTLNRAKIKHRIEVLPWARAYKIALEEPNVLIYSMIRLPWRESAFRWVGKVQNVDYKFYRHVSDKNINPVSLKEAKNYLIGVTKDSVQHKYLQQEGFTKLYFSPDTKTNLQLLAADRIDMVIYAEQGLSAALENANMNQRKFVGVLDAKGISAGIHIAMSKASTDSMFNKVHGAFKILDSEGAFDTIRAQFYRGK